MFFFSLTEWANGFRRGMPSDKLGHDETQLDARTINAPDPKKNKKKSISNQPTNDNVKKKVTSTRRRKSNVWGDTLILKRLDVYAWFRATQERLLNNHTKQLLNTLIMECQEPSTSESNQIISLNERMQLLNSTEYTMHAAAATKNRDALGCVRCAFNTNETAMCDEKTSLFDLLSRFNIKVSGRRKKKNKIYNKTLTTLFVDDLIFFKFFLIFFSLSCTVNMYICIQ